MKYCCNGIKQQENKTTTPPPPISYPHLVMVTHLSPYCHRRTAQYTATAGAISFHSFFLSSNHQPSFLLPHAHSILGACSYIAPTQCFILTLPPSILVSPLYLTRQRSRPGQQHTSLYTLASQAFIVLHRSFCKATLMVIDGHATFALYPLDLRS